MPRLTGFQIATASAIALLFCCVITLGMSLVDLRDQIAQLESTVQTHAAMQLEINEAQAAFNQGLIK